MRRQRYRGVAAALVAAWWACGGAHAQERVTLRTDLIFYGDNTEFRNPFREGETILGSAARVVAEIGIGERASIALGVFGDTRFGSESAFERVRPVLSLRLGTVRSAFVIGTLPVSSPGDPPGPDRAGPHKLLPPLQRETLSFERPYEAGLAWVHRGERLRQDVWLDWQRLNTPEHRERFDAGVNGDLRLNGSVRVPYQLLVVHEGGQQFASGPVSDSVGAALGVAASASAGAARTVTFEMYAVGARDSPDRERPERQRDGVGFFGRASGERRGWRAHLLFWRGRRFVTREGDPNYLSVRRDGTPYRGIRDYAEAGLTRTFRPAGGVLLEASGRLHRVEEHYEYSYRVLATADLRWRIR